MLSCTQCIYSDSFPSLALSKSGSRVFLTRPDTCASSLGPLACYFKRLTKITSNKIQMTNCNVSLYHLQSIYIDPSQAFLKSYFLIALHVMPDMKDRKSTRMNSSH